MNYKQKNFISNQKHISSLISHTMRLERSLGDLIRYVTHCTLKSIIFFDVISGDQITCILGE